MGDSIEIFNNCSDNEPTAIIYKNILDNDLPNYIFGGNDNYEYYCEVEVIKIKNGKAFVRFYPIGNYPQELKLINKCWVRLEKISVGVILDYIDKKFVLTIYDKPLYNSTFRNLQLDFDTYIFNIIDIKGSWLKVVGIVNKNYIQGWIPEYSQCTNMFSLCSGN